MARPMLFKAAIMHRLSALLLLPLAALTLRASDAAAQPTPSPSWWPPFIVWSPAPGTAPAAPPAAPAPSSPAAAPSTDSTWPGDWSQMEQDVFVLTNQRRLQGAICGGQSYAPARALVPDTRIRNAAREHSRDMGARNYFEHVSPDGRSPIDRMHALGWSGRTGGENIFGGQKNGAPLTAAEVVEGWMESPGHCTNIMNPRFTTLGVGFAATPHSRLGNYWTEDFGG